MQGYFIFFSTAHSPQIPHSLANRWASYQHSLPALAPWRWAGSTTAFQTRMKRDIYEHGHARRVKDHVRPWQESCALSFRSSVLPLGLRLGSSFLQLSPCSSVWLLEGQVGVGEEYGGKRRLSGPPDYTGSQMDGCIFAMSLCWLTSSERSLATPALFS